MVCKTRFPVSGTLRRTGAFVRGAILYLGTNACSSIHSSAPTALRMSVRLRANLPHIVLSCLYDRRRTCRTLFTVICVVGRTTTTSSMDGCAQKLIETAALRTLHAHSFSRASATASHTLSDLLARYLALLAAECAKYAHHAGRSSLSIYDALGALDDLGIGMDELTDFAAIEAKELSRYAVYSTRRIEVLNELRGTCQPFAVGLSLSPAQPNSQTASGMTEMTGFISNTPCMSLGTKKSKTWTKTRTW